MSERENGDLPVPNRAVRGRISSEGWEQIKTAYASGIGLREIARNMGIPEGTVLARAKREAWTREIQNAKALAKPENTSTAVTPFEAVSASMQQRGERHVSRMVGIVSVEPDMSKAWSRVRFLIGSMQSKNSTRLHGALSDWMKPGTAATT